jgi:hypothetical protein
VLSHQPEGTDVDPQHLDRLVELRPCRHGYPNLPVM